MKNQYTKFYIAFFYLCATMVLFAQPAAQNSTSDLESTDAVAAPINDYIWVLALMGLLFVFFKLKEFKNKPIAIKERVGK